MTHTNKGKLFCYFIDFQKAFDSAWHDGLLHKLLYKNIGGQFYHLISDMYLKGVFFDEFPCLLESSRDKDSITLPNGLPLNCLFYADDLILIARSVAGLQKQLNILHSYSEKWLLNINLKKTKTLIFQAETKPQINT